MIFFRFTKYTEWPILVCHFVRFPTTLVRKPDRSSLQNSSNRMLGPLAPAVLGLSGTPVAIGLLINSFDDRWGHYYIYKKEAFS